MLRMGKCTSEHCQPRGAHFGCEESPEGLLGGESDTEADRLRDALLDMVYQFAYPNGNGDMWTGGLSALECAFDALGWDDPHVMPKEGE